MILKKRAVDWGIQMGVLPTGKSNQLSDVSGVRVGHRSIKNGETQTGVTATLPHPGPLFQEKVVAAAHVFNGFGKTVGTVQINELGNIETPIILTNTLSVGVGVDALIQYMLQHNPEIGRTTGTVNPVVAECNDMILNDIRAGAILKEHVFEALADASDNFSEGAVGAGTGMVCYGLKGGIGSASRCLEYEHGTYHLGVMVLSNFGQLDHLTIAGKHVGPLIEKGLREIREQGSVIIILATDLPVSHRQLSRIIRRTAVGLARTGSFIGHGSGDIALGFSTAERVPHDGGDQLEMRKRIHETDIGLAFQAAAEATEEAVLHSLLLAETTTGRNGQTIYGLSPFIDDIL